VASSAKSSWAGKVHSTRWPTILARAAFSVTTGAAYRYAVFARLGDEPWTLWRHVHLLIA